MQDMTPEFNHSAYSHTSQNKYINVHSKTREHTTCKMLFQQKKDVLVISQGQRPKTKPGG